MLAFGLTAARCHEDEIRALEAEKARLTESLVPKAEFWAAVQRKGAALKEERALDPQAKELQARIDAAQGELAQLEKAVADARQRDAAAADAERAARERADAAAAALRERESRIAAIAVRQRASGPP